MQNIYPWARVVDTVASIIAATCKARGRAAAAGISLGVIWAGCRDWGVVVVCSGCAGWCGKVVARSCGIKIGKVCKVHLVWLRLDKMRRF